MGSLFQQGGLTQPGTALQGANGSTTIGAPDKILGETQKILQQRTQNAPLGQMADISNLPTIGQPSYTQAAGAGTPGGVNAMSPGLNKAGKLMTLLSSGLQGALAGRAKSEETVAATGGRRSGGVGMGFEAGYELPWQRESKQLGLQQQQAQVGATQAQSQMINTPSGPMPAWLAKAILPATIKAGATTEAAETGAASREKVAQGQQESQEKIHRYQPIPGVGMFDTQTRQVAPGTEQGVVVTPEIAKDHDLPQEFIGKPMKLTDLAAVRRSDVFQNAPMMTAQGPIVVNRKNATAQPVQGPGGQSYSPPALASPREVADTANPGQTVITSGAGAMGKPGVNSASVQVPKKAAAAAVPTNIGNQTVAFNTAIQHADLLRQAAKALNNGNVRVLADLSNRAQTQFGDPDLTNFNAIANAYNHEVTSVVSKNHITDAEVKNGGATMPSSANYETINKVLDSYQNLMQSKMNMLNKQTKAAVSASQPGGGKKVVEWHIENGQLVQGPAKK